MTCLGRKRSYLLLAEQISSSLWIRFNNFLSIAFCGTQLLSNTVFAVIFFISSNFNFPPVLSSNKEMIYFMNKQEFEDFIISGPHISEAKRLSKDLITKTSNYFSEIYNDISKKDKDASDKISCGSNSAMTLAGLTRHIDNTDISLMYSFNDETEKVTVLFDNKPLRFYFLSNHKMINNDTKNLSN